MDFKKASLWLKTHRIPVVSVVATGLMAVAASADSYFTCITMLVSDLATSLMPAFVNLVIAAAPVLIVLAIIGFILKFLDRILEMIHLK